MIQKHKNKMFKIYKKLILDIRYRSMTIKM